MGEPDFHVGLPPIGNQPFALEGLQDIVAAEKAMRDAGYCDGIKRAGLSEDFRDKGSRIPEHQPYSYSKLLCYWHYYVAKL